MCTTPCTRYILYYWPINKCWSIYLPNTWVMFSCMTARVESQNFGVTNEFSRLPHVHPAYPLFTAQPRSFYTLFFTLLCRERRSHGMILYFRGDGGAKKKVYVRKKKLAHLVGMKKSRFNASIGECVFVQQRDVIYCTRFGGTRITQCQKSEDFLLHCADVERERKRNF